jgi:hypothetical protein
MHPTQPLALRLQASRSLTLILVQVEIMTYTTPSILTSLEGPSDGPFLSRGKNNKKYLFVDFILKNGKFINFIVDD